MTKNGNFNNEKDEKTVLVKCTAKGGKEITREECEYLNQKDKAREKGREKSPKYSNGMSVERKLCIDCEMYPPFNKL